jgi:CRP/FNR family transcriptional regulator, cyclic AMP receptor protein
MAGKKRYVFTQKRKELAAAMLAQKIGYLRLEDFPRLSSLDSLPTQSLSPHRIIRPEDELFFIREGKVEIWHTHHDMLVSELGQGTLFGDISLLGQTMLGCKAIVGPEGATLAAISAELIREWIRADPLSILEELGPRLSVVEAEHYRASFQAVDSRVAALLLELAGSASSIEGYTHAELSMQIGAYRETVTIALNALKSDRIIEIGRKRIMILDRRALRELSEL